jgi:hypothetical protein
MSRPKGQLVSHAHALDAIFVNLMRRGLRSIDKGYLDAGERYTRLALKAQAQCRAILDSLTEMKNPPAGGIRQASQYRAWSPADKQ